MAQSYCASGLGKLALDTTRYAVLFSRQDSDVLDFVTKDLKKQYPHIRLVYCSSFVGMAYDSPSVPRTVHGKPPRNSVDYVQQIGRAARNGQPSCSVACPYTIRPLCISTCTSILQSFTVEVFITDLAAFNKQICYFSGKNCKFHCYRLPSPCPAHARRRRWDKER